MGNFGEHNWGISVSAITSATTTSWHPPRHSPPFARGPEWSTRRAAAVARPTVGRAGWTGLNDAPSWSPTRSTSTPIQMFPPTSTSGLPASPLSCSSTETSNGGAHLNGSPDTAEAGRRSTQRSLSFEHSQAESLCRSAEFASNESRQVGVSGCPARRLTPGPRLAPLATPGTPAIVRGTPRPRPTPTPWLKALEYANSGHPVTTPALSCDDRLRDVQQISTD